MNITKEILSVYLKHAYTGIWWYASQPNHYRGYGSYGNKELGEAVLKLESDLLAEMIRSVKQDTVTLELQQQFFTDSETPLKTKQQARAAIPVGRA